MARPVTHLDLSPSDTHGEQIFSWDYKIMSKPAIAKHLVAAVEAAEKAGFLVEDTAVYTKASAEVLEERLARAQRRWDELEGQYRVAVEFPPGPNSDLYYINQWARENGFPVIAPNKD